MEAEQRAEGVAVGALVGGQQEALAVSQLQGDALEVGGGRSRAVRFDLPFLSSNSEMRTPFSIVSS